MAIKPLNPHYSFENPASVYDEEAMTALKLAGRQAAKINEVVNAQNTLETETEAHLEQQDNTIKERLDQQDSTIEERLDQQDAAIPVAAAAEMQKRINDGTFEREIDAYAGNLESRVNNLLGSFTGGGTTMDAEVVDMRMDTDGNVHSSAGVAVRHMFDTLPVTHTALTEAGDLNNMYRAGTWLVGTSAQFTNVPGGFYQKGLQLRYIVVETFGTFSVTGHSAWGRQTIYTVGGAVAYQRYFSNGEWPVYWEGWRKIPTSTVNHTTIDAACDIDRIVEAGDYTIATGSHSNAPAAFSGGGFKLRVDVFAGSWLTQTASSLYSSETYVRSGKVDWGYNFHETMPVTWYSDWERSITEQRLASVADELSTRIDGLSEAASNHGYLVLNMGDSIFGNTNDSTSISSVLAAISGATVKNCAFGGCQMTNRNEAAWSPFSMCNLATAIATNNWTAQDAAIANYTGTLPGYFSDHVTSLKNTDFSKVDVVTIAYGTNDYSAWKSIENTANRLDNNTFKGALRYSIETMYAAYPNIRFVLCTPLWRCWFENGTLTSESDSVTENGKKLSDFATAVREVAAEYHIPVCDYYNDAGVSKHNWATFFNNNDGTHPHAKGRQRMAKLLKAEIAKL